MKYKAAFKVVGSKIKAQHKRDFLIDLQGQFEENESIQEILDKRTVKKRPVAVTFDRRRNDKKFSYSDFDLLLAALDATSGGVGLRRPCNQLRVLDWNSRRLDLLKVLKHFSTTNRTLRVRKLLILPFPDPIVGSNLDPAVYLYVKQ